MICGSIGAATLPYVAGINGIVRIILVHVQCRIEHRACEGIRYARIHRAGIRAVTAAGAAGIDHLTGLQIEDEELEILVRGARKLVVRNGTGRSAAEDDIPLAVLGLVHLVTTAVVVRVHLRRDPHNGRTGCRKTEFFVREFPHQRRRYGRVGEGVGHVQCKVGRIAEPFG